MPDDSKASDDATTIYEAAYARAGGNLSYATGLLVGALGAMLGAIERTHPGHFAHVLPTMIQRMSISVHQVATVPLRYDA